MLTALLVLILIALVLIERDIVAFREMLRDIWECPKCHGSGHDVENPEERCVRCFGAGTAIGELNSWLPQIVGRLDSIHDAIYKLWACPTCHGSGFISNSENFLDMVPPKGCETCEGTGMKPAGMKWPIPGGSGEDGAKENR